MFLQSKSFLTVLVRLSATDVTIIEIEIEIVFLTENRIESKSYFSCIPSNDLSIEALDRCIRIRAVHLCTTKLVNAQAQVCYKGVVIGRCHETPHRPHRPQNTGPGYWQNVSGMVHITDFD